jgi:UDP-N-acetylglucosamine 2-epimerase (non-hydrolysing)
MSARKILTVFGTRPEAIKMAPVIRELQKPEHGCTVRVCVTAQHRKLLDQVLPVFNIQPDHDLDCMTPGQTLAQSASRILAALEPVLAAEAPDMVLVQGDTTTTFCGALAAFYRGVAIGHIEAGLRTGDLRQPFPEEMNRLLTSRLAALHFAATPWAACNLRAEGVPEASISVTGNTGIDAVLQIRDRLAAGTLQPAIRIIPPEGKRLILVTAHRRESFGPGFERICRALATLARRPDVHIIYPVHPNPNVQDPVNRHLRGFAAVQLVDPLDYVTFVDLMRRAYILVTDSGGVQEEGPSLGKPILVLREKTERPEAVEAGTVRLVGTSETRLLEELERLLDDPNAYSQMTRVHNPYGDGHASERIAMSVSQFTLAV